MREIPKRAQELLDLIDEISEAKIYHKFTDRTQLTYLAAGLWTVVKNTRLEGDARALIEELYPDFFNE